MVDYRFETAAEDEFDLAQDWYAARSRRALAGFVAAVDKAIDTIRHFPDAFPRYDAGHRFTRVPKYPFTIYHQPGDPVVIVAIAHHQPPPGYRHGRG